MSIVIGIILLIGAIVFNVIYDYSIWLKQLNNSKNIRNHAKGAILKVASCIPAIIAFSIASNFKLLIALSSSIILSFAWFLLLFDGLYNIFRGEPFFFRGTEDNNEDAKTDNFWQSVPQWAHITLKALFALITISWYWLGL